MRLQLRIKLGNLRVTLREKRGKAAMDDGPRIHGTITDLSKGSISTKQYFVFNHQGQIDLLKLPDFDRVLASGPVNEKNFIPFEDLVSACVVHHVAAILGVTPGMFRSGDMSLKAELKHRLRNAFVDIDAEVERLIKAWHKVAIHPLAQPYRNLYRTRSLYWNRFGKIFDPFDSFDLFIRAYMVGLAKVLAYSQSHQDQIDKYLSAITLVEANFRGRWYYENKFIQYPILLEHVEELAAKLPRDQKVSGLLEVVQGKCGFLKRMWYTQNRDYIHIGIDDFHEKYADHMIALCQIMYFFCVGKDYTDLEPFLKDGEEGMGFEVFEELSDPFKLVKNPQHQNYRQLLLNRDVGPEPTNKDIRHAVIACCYLYGHENGIFSFHDKRKKPLWHQIGARLVLDQQIKEDAAFDVADMEVWELYHFGMKAKDEELKALLMDELKKRCIDSSKKNPQMVYSRGIFSRRGTMPLICADTVGIAAVRLSLARLSVDDEEETEADDSFYENKPSLFLPSYSHLRQTMQGGYYNKREEAYHLKQIASTIDAAIELVDEEKLSQGNGNGCVIC